MQNYGSVNHVDKKKVFGRNILLVLCLLNTPIGREALSILVVSNNVIATGRR